VDSKRRGPPAAIPVVSRDPSSLRNRACTKQCLDSVLAERRDPLGLSLYLAVSE